MPADPAKTHVAKTFTHTSPLISCRFDPTGKFVFAGSEDSRVSRWEIETGKKLEFVGQESWVRSLAFNATGELLVTGGYDGRLLWWSANTTEESPKPQRKIDAHKGFIRAIAVSPDTKTFATCGVDRIVRIWQMDSGTLVKELAGHDADIWNLAFHPGGKDLVSGDLKSNFIRWEVETGKVASKFQLPALTKYDPTFMADIGGPHSMEFSKDGKWLAIGGITNVSNAFAGIGNGAIVLWDWDAQKEKVMHVAKKPANGSAWGCHVHPEGFTIGAFGGGGGGHLYFWKLDQKEEFHTLSLGNTARDMAVHPDGLQIATAHFDKQLRLSKMVAKA